jgi:hypothetical protein
MKSLVINVLAVTVLAGLVSVNAHAASITVDKTNPCANIACTSITGDLQAGCTFGEAITAINERMDVGDCKNESSDAYGIDDTIHLPAGATLPFYAGFTHYDQGPTALPPILQSVVIRGHGATLVRQSDPEEAPAKAEADALRAEAEILAEIDLDQEPEKFRFFEVNEGSDLSQVFLTWDETRFVGGNPGCGCAYGGECDYDQYTCFSGGAGYIHGTRVFASFENVTFEDNSTNLFSFRDRQRGGAVAIGDGEFSMVNFFNAVFKSNKSPFGGAVYAGEGSQVAISDSTFTGNVADARNYAGPESLPMVPLDAAGSRLGGAVLTDGDSLTIAHSAFFKNLSRVGGAVAARNGLVSVQNSSFFANHADLAGGSVAIPYNYQGYFDGQGDLYRKDIGFLNFARDSLATVSAKVSVALHNVTITQNSSGNSTGESSIAMGGGIANLGPGAFYLKNTILSGNTVMAGGSGDDCHGTFVSLGRNNIGATGPEGTCLILPEAGADPDLKTDPGLKPCVENSAAPGLASCDPLATSAMIDAAASCPADDQHHTARNTALCTVGAIEYVKSCEDGVDHAGESCPTDDGVLQGITCGNGQAEEGEECDAGESGNSDTLPNACRTDCTNPVCGDGVVDSEFGEICDGGATCFDECRSVVVPSEECGISAEDLMDPSLKTNDDVVARFGYPAVEKCLHVFGGGDSSCALNPSASGPGMGSVVALLMGLIPMIVTGSFARRSRPSSRT